MTSDELDEAATGIAKSSDGLPQHPIYETVALFWGIKQADYDWAEVDFAAIESRAAGYREDSCWARQSPETEECLNLVAAVMATVPTQ